MVKKMIKELGTYLKIGTTIHLTNLDEKPLQVLYRDDKFTYNENMDVHIEVTVQFKDKCLTADRSQIFDVERIMDSISLEEFHNECGRTIVDTVTVHTRIMQTGKYQAETYLGEYAKFIKDGHKVFDSKTMDNFILRRIFKFVITNDLLALEKTKLNGKIGWYEDFDIMRLNIDLIPTIVLKNENNLTPDTTETQSKE
jgi:hypothetical protein